MIFAIIALNEEGIMANQYAEFYKCALQVNPYDYIKYRGEEHQFEEQSTTMQYSKTVWKQVLKL